MLFILTGGRLACSAREAAGTGLAGTVLGDWALPVLLEALVLA